MFDASYGSVEFMTMLDSFLFIWALKFLVSRARHKVTRVIDGDTVKARIWPLPEITIRLYEIDAPESKQGGGAESTLALNLLCPPGTRIKLQGSGEKGRYARNISLIFVGPVNVNEEMVRRGHAWCYMQHHSCPMLPAIEEEARKAKRGLWKDRKPKAPWQWRKDQKAARAAANDAKNKAA